MESQIFTWETVEKHVNLAYGYYKVELVVNVGKYPKGTKFAYVDVDYNEASTMTFYAENATGDNEPEMTCKMSLQLEVQ